MQARAAMAKCRRTVPTSSIRPSRSWAVGRTFAWSRGSPLAPASVVGRRTRLRSCDGQARAAQPGWKWQPSSAQTSPSASPVAPGQGCAGPARSSSLCALKTLPISPIHCWCRPSASPRRPFTRLGTTWVGRSPTISNRRLEPAALRVEPRLATWRDRFARLRQANVRCLQVAVRHGSSLGAYPRREPGCRPGFAGSCRGQTGELSAYLPARLCQRVAFSIFLCFFLRIRLRRFFINDPMAAR